MDFDRMWAELAPIGRSATSGGYLRAPFDSAERECAAWFAQQCQSRDLAVEVDGNGNAVGWWEPERVPPAGAVGRTGSTVGAVLTGSHLDSVPDGGAFDGPLGVVSALAAVDRLREQGFVPRRPIGVVSFVAEEGSRFPVACLGSRLAVGAVDPAGQTAMAEAMAAAGLEPGLGPSDFLTRVGYFVELHVEQGRNLVDTGAAVGVGGAIWPHGRYRFDFIGEANHAGATRMEDRHDPMLSYAMTVLAANKQARLAPTAHGGSARATFGRVDVEPNGTNAVPSRVTGWLDARADTSATLERLLAEVTRQGSQRADRDGTALTVTTESVSPQVVFDGDLARRIATQDGSRSWPILASQAGHDAGILAAAGIPTAMLFVRNPTGISHAPAESASMADCVAGVDALAQTLVRLAS